MDLVTLLNDPGSRATLMLLAIWSMIWKGFALWRAARNNQKNWFIAMVIINTFGILEIVYLFFFSKPKAQKNLDNV